MFEISTCITPVSPELTDSKDGEWEIVGCVVALLAMDPVNNSRCVTIAGITKIQNPKSNDLCMIVQSQESEKQMTIMGDISRYWKLVTINAAGQRTIKEISAAKAFIQQEFTTSAEDNIQHQLLSLYTNSHQQLLAGRCLLCFISWMIEQTCLHLEKMFGVHHGFSCNDLLQYVLDDDGSLEIGSYQCFSQKILQSFDCKQGSLTTWVSMKVKHHHELNKFLLECGVYLVSNWAILNDTTPKQLERILREFHYLSDREIAEAQNLLLSYHTVYRTQRLRQRAQGIKGRCQPPTTQQLTEIAQNLKRAELKTETIIRKLEKLAEQLRSYRIHIRRGSLPTESLNVIVNENIAPLSEPSSSIEEQQIDFLRAYRAEFKTCLQKALVNIMEARIKQLKHQQKIADFLTALELFHCKNLSMTEIAVRLGLKAQYAVTRLLKLKEFRADIRRTMLVDLEKYLEKEVSNYVNAEYFKKTQEQIIVTLDEQIAKLLEEAQNESYTGSNSYRRSLFARNLCKYLQATIN